MALLNVAVTFEFVGTNVAPDPGTVAITVGAVLLVVMPVVKAHP